MIWNWSAELSSSSVLQKDRLAIAGGESDQADNRAGVLQIVLDWLTKGVMEKVPITCCGIAPTRRFHYKGVFAALYPWMSRPGKRKDSRMRACAAVVSLTLVALCSCPAMADDARKAGVADQLSAAEQIRGAWVRYRDTAEGRYTTIKEHFGDHTVVTTYDPQMKPVESHRSEYRVDEGGKVPTYLYRNRTVLVGPSAGAKDNRELTYLFRIEGDTFYEVHGMLPGDSGRPSLITWERHQKPVPQPAN
jgi:hypothetical protein